MRASRRTRPLPRWDAALQASAARAAAPVKVVAVPGLELFARPQPAAPAPAPAPADRRVALLEARAAIAEAAHTSATAAGALRACVRELCGALGWPLGRALLLDAAGAPAASPVWHGAAGPRHDAFRDALAALPARGAAARAVAAGKPVWIADLRQGGAPAATAGYDAGLRAAVAFPVQAAGGVGAVVELYADRAEGCDAAVLDACAAAARQLTAALERIAELDARRGDADLLRAVVEGSPSPVACFDADGALALWSPAAEEALGWSAEAAAARLADGADAGWIALADAAGRARAGATATSATLRWTRADGGARRVEVRCLPLLAPGGRVSGVAAHLADRTARDAAEDAADRGRQDVLATVAHDLRSPLHAISLLSETLLRGWRDPERTAERAQVAAIAQSADRMRRLVADLMEVVQEDAGAFAVAPQPLPAGILLHRAVEAHRPLAEEKGVALAVASFPAALVMADEQRVYQVFSNLVGNALRHTPAGGAVTLSAEPAGDSVRLSVADSGCGIAAEDLPKVFERFWRGTRCRGGAGLGLSIARTIVEAHGGRVWAESRPGQGATFSFTLPLSDPASATA